MYTMPLQDTLIFMWFGVAPKNGYQKDKCFKEIGLLAQNMTIILGSYLANIIFFGGGGLYEHEHLHFDNK